MMVGTSSKNYDIGSSEVDAPSWKHYYYSILFEEVGHLPIRTLQDLPLAMPYDFSVSEVRPLPDVLDTRPFQGMGYASTSRRTLEAEC